MRDTLMWSPGERHRGEWGGPRPECEKNCQQHHYLVYGVTIYTNVHFANHYLSSFFENYQLISVVFFSFRYLPQAVTAAVLQVSTAGLYKPCTRRIGQCMNHAQAILAAPALIYGKCYFSSVRMEIKCYNSLFSVRNNLLVSLSFCPQKT